MSIFSSIVHTIAYYFHCFTEWEWEEGFPIGKSWGTSAGTSLVLPSCPPAEAMH